MSTQLSFTEISFLGLVLDEDLLRTEFDAIIAAGWSEPEERTTWHRRAAAAPGRTPDPISQRWVRRRRAADTPGYDSPGYRRDWVRARSPPQDGRLAALTGGKQEPFEKGWEATVSIEPIP